MNAARKTVMNWRFTLWLVTALCLLVNGLGDALRL